MHRWRCRALGLEIVEWRILENTERMLGWTTLSWSSIRQVTNLGEPSLAVFVECKVAIPSKPNLRV